MRVKEYAVYPYKPLRKLFRASFSTHITIVWSLIQYTPLNHLDPHSVHTPQLFKPNSVLFFKRLEPHLGHTSQLVGA